MITRPSVERNICRSLRSRYASYVDQSRYGSELGSRAVANSARQTAHDQFVEERRQIAGRQKAAQNLAARSGSSTLEAVDLAHLEVAALIEPAHLANRDDFARAVRESRLLCDQLHAGRDLFADRA